MSIKKVMDTLKMLEEQRRLADPFYADLGDRENVLLKRLKEVTRAETGRHAKVLDRLEISLDALRLKCQETKYRFKQIQQLTQPITDRTFDRTIVTKDGIKVRASLGIDSDSVAFEFDTTLSSPTNWERSCRRACCTCDASLIRLGALNGSLK